MSPLNPRAKEAGPPLHSSRGRGRRGRRGGAKNRQGQKSGAGGWGFRGGGSAVDSTGHGEDEGHDEGGDDGGDDEAVDVGALDVYESPQHEGADDAAEDAGDFKDAEEGGEGAGAAVVGD